MRQEWISQDECRLDGVRFVCSAGSYDVETDKDTIYVLKGRDFFDKYDYYLRGDIPKTVLEVGIFEGGSAILLADKWPEAKIVGIDIRKKNDHVIEHLARFGMNDRVSLHYEVSQANQRDMEAIIATEFSDGIDLIIDDASHDYDYTKRCFNICFPHLRPGGRYVIEDWGWAHWPDWQGRAQWQDRPALSNLLFEIIMAGASASYAIGEVYSNANFFVVQKALNCPPRMQNFNIENLYKLRGKVFPRI